MRNIGLDSVKIPTISANIKMTNMYTRFIEHAYLDAVDRQSRWSEREVKPQLHYLTQETERREIRPGGTTKRKRGTKTAMMAIFKLAVLFSRSFLTPFQAPLEISANKSRHSSSIINTQESR